MSRARNSALPAVYLLFIVVSLIIGWWMPAYYDWTGADQSRSAPVASYTAWGLIGAAAIVWLTLPWLPAADESCKERRTKPFRFSTRSLLIATSAIAVGTALLLKWPSLMGGIFCGLAFSYSIWFAITRPDERLPTAALAGCVLLPYLWAVTGNLMPLGQAATLRLMLSVPALLPTAILGNIAGRSLHELEWLGMLLTGAEVLIGIWMIRLGPKPTIAYLVLVCLLSTFGSFGVHSLARM